MVTQELKNWIDPRKDTEHIPLDWYREQLSGSTEDVKKATRYLVVHIPLRCGEHFLRGAVGGGLVGLMTTGNEKVAALSALVGGVADWTQYGVRAMLKIENAYKK